MLTNNLFEEILIKPALSGCNNLYIISGYATSAMAFHHLTELSDNGKNDLNIKLIVGMSSLDGLSASNHNGFRSIMENEYSKNFECSYRTVNPPNHSKMYIWQRNNKPMHCYIGSANYTQTAFNERRQREAMSSCFPADGLSYFNSLIDDSIYCNHHDAESTIKIYNERIVRRRQREIAEIVQSEEQSLFQPDFNSLESAQVSLLSSRTNQVHNRGGLNWGQRPGREQNQAYLQLSPDVYRSDFFPIRSIHFTVLADDNITLICTRAQKDEIGQAIETPHNNSLLGEYFRNRLGLANGVYVNTEDLIKYGKTDVTFYKIDDENYYMDFSVS